MIVRLKRGVRSRDAALLSEDRDYTVYAIRSTSPVRLMVSGELSFPFFVDANDFDVIEGSMPENWVFHAGGQCNAEIEFPEMAGDVAFYQNLVDGSSGAAATWSRVKALMDQEAQERATIRKLGANPKAPSSTGWQENTIYVVLRIVGRPEDIEQVARRLSVLNGRVEKVSGDERASWYFNVADRDVASTAPVVRAMLEGLHPCFADVIDIARDDRFEASLDCTVFCEKGSVRLEICGEALRDLATLQITVSFDVNATQDQGSPSS